MGKRKPETASQMMEALSDFLFGPEPDFKRMAPDELAAFVSKHGLDVEPVLKAAKAALKASGGQLELELARRKRLKLAEERRASVPRQGLREHLLAQIKAIAGPSQAAVYARKFEDSPEEDLATILEDFEWLDQLDVTLDSTEDEK